MNYKILTQFLAGSLLSMILAYSVSTKDKNDYVNGWLIKNDGEKIECLVRLFMFDADKITYKTSERDKKGKTLKSTELQEIVLEMGDSTVILNKYKSATYSALGKFKSDQGDKWMQKIYETDRVSGYNMIIYEGGGHVGTNAFGGPMFAGGKFLTVQYGIKMTENDYVVFFPIELWWDRSDVPKAFDTIYKKILAKYLKDYCPSYAKSIKKLDYRLEKFEDSLDDINSKCK
jgi:arsenate reductase-like glutaredoxin family protein